MTGPNVGKVTLKAAIETGDLRNQLTRDISAKVMPQLKGLFDEVRNLNKELGRVEGTSFEDIAKKAGIASKEMEKVNAASEKAAALDRTARRSREAELVAIRRQSEAWRKLRAEVKDTGVASTETQASYDRLNRLAVIAIEERVAKEKKAADALAAIDDARLSARQDYHDKITSFHNEELNQIKEMISAKDKEADSIIASAMKSSDQEIAAGRKTMTERDSQRKKDEKSDKDSLARRRKLQENYYSSLAAVIEKARTLQDKMDNRAPSNAFGKGLNELSKTLGTIFNLGRTPAALPIIISIVQAVSQLATVASSASQAILLIPAGIAAVGAAALTTTFITQGLDDALKAVFSNDPKALQKAIENLSPGAAKFIGLVKEIQPLLEEVQKATQDAFFNEQTRKNFSQLVSAFQPVVKELTTTLARTFANFGTELTKALLDPKTQTAIAAFVNGTEKAFKAFEPAIGPLTSLLATLVGEGASILPQVASWFADIAKSFNDWIQEASQSGELHDMLVSGLAAVKDISEWVGKLVRAWFTLAPVGDQLLPTINQLMDQLIALLPNVIKLIAGMNSEWGGIALTLGTINSLLTLVNTGTEGITSHFLSWLNPLNLLQTVLVNIARVVNALPGPVKDLFGIDEIKTVNGQDINAPTFNAEATKTFNDALDRRDAAIRAAGGTPPPRGGIDPTASLPSPVGIPGLPDGTIPGQIPLTPEQRATKIIADRFLAADQAAHPGRGAPDGTPRAPGVGVRGVPLHIPDTGEALAGSGPNAAKPETDADAKKRIEGMFDPKDFQVDPWAGAGAPNVNNGLLQVALPNGIPGLNLPAAGAFPGIPGVPGAQPGPLGGNDAGTIANYIAQKAMAQGYSAQEAQAFVAQALGESGLDPRAFGANTGDSTGGASGIFQFTPGTAKDYGLSDPLNAQANIDAYFRLAQDRDPRSGDIASRLAKISGGGPAAGGTLGDFMDRAASLLGPMTATPGAGVPSMPAITGGPDVRGAHPALADIASIAQQLFGLQVTAGRDDHSKDGGYHPKGEAVDIGGGTPETRAAFTQYLEQNFLPYLSEVINKGPGVTQNVKDSKLTPAIDMPGSIYSTSQAGDHSDHVHVAIADQLAQAFMAALGQAPGQSGLPTLNKDALGGPAADVFGSPAGYVVDPDAVRDANTALKQAGDDLSKSGYELAVATQEFKEGLISQQDLLDKQNKYQDDQTDLQKKQDALTEAQQGKYQASKPADYSKLPFGDPRRILAGAIGGAGGSPEDIAALVGPILGSVGAPIGQVAGQVATDVGLGFGPKMGGPGGPGVLALGTPFAPQTDVNQLVQERNPLALAQMSGFNVPDYSRAGGGPGAQNLTLNGGPPNDPTGRIYSDTAALIDRTFTNQDAADKARFDQQMAVLNEIKDKLSSDLLGPVVQDAVAKGIQGVGDQLGQSIGQTAGPIIAQAVASAIPSGGASGANSGVGGIPQTAFNIGTSVIGGIAGGGFTSWDAGSFADGYHPVSMAGGRVMGNLYDEGGLWESGTFGTNLSGAPERVLNPLQTSLFDQGLLGGWNLQPLQQQMATVSGQIANDTVGADFFGVSQIPILGAIVNLLMRVLLKVLGVEIESRDTLDEMSKGFREFRGDFQAFDASGRLLNDTSALLDRSSTSEETAAAERIRILKIVIEALIKFIIEKLIIPIGKAIANSIINAGAGAAGGALSGAFPGGSIVGGAVQSVISTAGSASVDIIGDIAQEFLVSLTSVGVQAIGEALTSYLPGAVSSLFGGGLVENLIAAPFTAIISPLLGLLGAVSLPFDSGGVASGVGYMPKATIRPERVLSPQQTQAFERWMSRGSTGDTNSRVVHTGDIHFHGQDAPQQAYNKLLSLLGGS